GLSLRDANDYSTVDLVEHLDEDGSHRVGELSIALRPEGRSQIRVALTFRSRLAGRRPLADGANDPCYARVSACRGTESNCRHQVFQLCEPVFVAVHYRSWELRDRIRARADCSPPSAVACI